MAEFTQEPRTIIRIPTPIRVALRSIFAVAERLAPDAGAALAVRLWCTVPPVSRRKGRPAKPVVAGEFGRGEPVVAYVGDSRVVGEMWGEGSPVYVSAGWGGWRGQMAAFVLPLVEAGFRVIAFDPLSHGESDGGAMGSKRTTLDEYADSLKALADVAGEPYGIVTHSGGCVAAGVAVSDGLPVERMVLIAPMADPVPYIGDFRRLLGIGDRVGSRIVSHLERVVGRPLADFRLSEMAPKMTMPTLIVHDQLDKYTPVSDGEAIAQAWPNTVFLATSDLGHTRILRDPSVVETVTKFLTPTPTPTP